MKLILQVQKKKNDLFSGLNNGLSIQLKWKDLFSYLMKSVKKNFVTLLLSTIKSIFVSQYLNYKRLYLHHLFKNFHSTTLILYSSTIFNSFCAKRLYYIQLSFYQILKSHLLVVQINFLVICCSNAKYSKRILA